ncbi:MAG: PadR family transcriptional regulator [bacterium]
MPPRQLPNKNELAALGLINWTSMHGYLLNQMIQRLGLDQWANVSQSSIYYSLGKLTERGAATKTTEREGKAPERTIFHITIVGRQILRTQLRQALRHIGSDDLTFYLAMSFIDALPLAETVELLTARIARLEEIINNEERAACKAAMAPHFALSCQAGAKHMTVEREYCQQVVDLLTDQPDYFEKLGGMIDDI